MHASANCSWAVPAPPVNDDGLITVDILPAGCYTTLLYTEAHKGRGYLRMDRITRTNLDNIYSQDRQLQYESFLYVMKATDEPVDWAYEVWDDLVTGLSHKDNHVRAIAAQVLCNLAKSDPKNRMRKDFHSLIAVTKDERFVTARHCLQSLWKVGAAGKKQQKMLVEGLAGRFEECITEKNGTLIRYDIIQDLKNLYDEVKDEQVKETALELIETEQDLKYRKKYASVWRKR